MNQTETASSIVKGINFSTPQIALTPILALSKSVLPRDIPPNVEHLPANESATNPNTDMEGLVRECLKFLMKDGHLFGGVRDVSGMDSAGRWCPLPRVLTFDVGGRIFRVPLVQLARFPQTRLGRIVYLLSITFKTDISVDQIKNKFEEQVWFFVLS